MSFPKRKRIILIVLIAYSLLECLGAAGSPAIANAQRKEIEKLREDLNKALAKTAVKTPAAEGIIVQPTWTNNAPGAIPVDGTVKVTSQGLAEVQAIRAELQQAIANDTFVPKIANSSAGNPEHIRQLQRKFEAKALGKNLLSELTGSAAAAGNQSSSQPVGALMSSPNGENNQEPGSADEPNVVVANVADEDIDIRKLQRLEVSKRRNRELLILASIEEDYSFDIGADVVEWEHITHAKAEYFIGRRHTDLLIAQKQGEKYTTTARLDVGQPISYLDTFSYWDTSTQQQEGVILVASGNRVLWYSGQNGTDQIEFYWQWTVGHPISGLRYFAIESRDYLVISSNQSSRSGYYALSIYQFDLYAKEFWVAQRLQLRYPCGEVRLLNTGRDIILAVPQNNTADIYAFNPRAEIGEHVRFQLLRQFTSEGIQHIAGFQMGGRSYLALGGLQPQILRYQQGDFISRTILGNNFGFVELFFPIPVRTYRDDLLLLVQHRVDFGTHQLTVLETLIWNGESFEASIPVPCRMGAHTLYGVSCMLDLHRDEGLKGAALLRRGSNEANIVVPRHKAESGLFRLHTQLMAKNSELLDLQEIFDFLQDWVKEQDDLIAQAQRYLAMPEEELAKAQPDLSSLKQLKTPQLHFDGEVGAIMVNDYKWTDEDSKTDLNSIMQAIEALEKELTANAAAGGGRRTKREIPEFAKAGTSLDTLKLDSIDVDDLQLKLLNGEKFFVDDGHLRFPGILNIKDLEVAEQTPIMRFPESRQTVEDSMQIDGNLEFELINGVSWQELLDMLVFNNKPQTIGTLEVEGEVSVEGNISVGMLNMLRFPDEYLWSSGPSNTIVRGEKVFIGNLSTNVIVTEGDINDVNPMDAITLHEPQYWTGMPTFTQLEVSEVFELNGTAHRRDFEEIPNNPTLQESNIIAAGCQFRHLEVLGDIHLYGDYNEQALGPQLADVVLKPDFSQAANPIIIKGKKDFNHIEFPLDVEVADGAFNNVTVERFITLNTPQKLNTSALRAFVYFNHLNVSGTYDGVRIEELMGNALKIDEPQFSPQTQLNFADGIAAPALHVRDTLNGVSLLTGYQRLNAPLELDDVEFEHLRATQVADLPADIEGFATARLNGKLLKDLFQQPNAEDLHIYVKELTLEKGAEIATINGSAAETLLNFLDAVEDLPEMILEGQVEVDQISVLGDIWLQQRLNGEHFDDEFLPSLVWLNRPNLLNSKLHFKEPLEIHGDLNVLGDFNGENIVELIDDIVVRQPNGSVLIAGPKKFLHSILVSDDTSVGGLNGVPFAYFANKRDKQHFNGSLKVHGNLVVRELEVLGQLNGYPTKNLTSKLKFDPQLKAFVLLGNIQMPESEHVFEDLTVFGRLNEIANLSNFFEQLVYKNSVSQLRGNYTFNGRVSITGGFNVIHLNDVPDMYGLLENVVLTHDHTQSIAVSTPVHFQADVQVLSNAVIHGSLETGRLSGCQLSDWLNDTLRVDEAHTIARPLTFADGSLDGNRLEVLRLNGVDLSQIVTLHTPQNFTGHWQFSDLFLAGEMQVLDGGAVNGLNLQEEYENTLLTQGDQRVSTPLTFSGNVRVFGDLRVDAPVDGDKLLQDTVTLDGNQEFETPLYFRDLRVRGGIHTNDTISGIDFVEWQEQAVRQGDPDRPPQLITGNWSVGRLLVRQRTPTPPPTFMLPTTGSTEMALQPFYDAYMRSARSKAGAEVNGKEANETKRCRKLLAQAQPRPYRLRHMEWRSELLHTLDSAEWAGWFVQDTPRAFVLAATAEAETASRAQQQPVLLLLNVGCQSQVYGWHAVRGRFEKVCAAATPTGRVQQAVRVGASEVVILNPAVGEFKSTDEAMKRQANATDCLRAGLHVWHFNGSCLAHAQHLNSLPVVNDVRATGTTLYALAADSLYELKGNFSAGANPKKVWPLPAGMSRPGEARFLPHPKQIWFSDGQHLYALPQGLSNQSTSLESHSPIQPRSLFSLPPMVSRGRPLAVNHKDPARTPTASQSVLHPTMEEERQLTFADFQQLVVLILLDLNHRLTIEMKITQLSIPESDLYDEHLVQDFIDIMTELQRQQIYPTDTFAKVAFERLQLPGSPAQVLAARAVIAAWPVIVEVQEVNRHLRANTSAAHPICACLTSQLGLMVRDVLLIANAGEAGEGGATITEKPKAAIIEEDKNSRTLSAVIERIREFQKYLQDLSQQLEEDIQQRISQQSDKLADESEMPLLAHALAGGDNLKIGSFENAFFRLSLPSGADHATSQPIALRVGMATENPRFLLAAVSSTNASLQFTANSQDSIRLYHLPTPPVAGGSATTAYFQTLPAQRPRLLHTLRIRDETLLAYVEHCCHVHVLLYRGVQGFIPFAQFRTEAEVLQLFSFRVEDVGEDTRLAGGVEKEPRFNYYLASVLQDRLHFYEVLIAERQALPAECK